MKITKKDKGKTVRFLNRRCGRGEKIETTGKIKDVYKGQISVWHGDFLLSVSQEEILEIVE